MTKSYPQTRHDVAKAHRPMTTRLSTLRWKPDHRSDCPAIEFPFCHWLPPSQVGSGFRSESRSQTRPWSCRDCNLEWTDAGLISKRSHSHLYYHSPQLTLRHHSSSRRGHFLGRRTRWRPYESQWRGGAYQDLTPAWLLLRRRYIRYCQGPGLPSRLFVSPPHSYRFAELGNTYM